MKNFVWHTLRLNPRSAMACVNINVLVFFYDVAYTYVNSYTHYLSKQSFNVFKQRLNENLRPPVTFRP
jgi:hypothetical protein